MSELQRKDDFLIGQLIQKIDNIAQWQRDHDVTSNAWRESIDKRLQPLEELANGAKLSWKLVLAIAALVAALVKAYDWIKDHVR